MPEARVLLVEDEMLLREVTSADLADSGFAVTCASNGAEARTVLDRGEQFAVLITDIRMPGELDGWELARYARAARPDIAVIYISGYSGDGEVVPGGLFLKKPYRLQELQGALASFGMG